MNTYTNKQIAGSIQGDYMAGNYVVSKDHATLLDGDVIEFTLGTFKVRCKNSPDAVAAVVRKFTKTQSYGGKSCAWPVRRRAA